MRPASTTVGLPANERRGAERSHSFTNMKHTAAPPALRAGARSNKHHNHTQGTHLIRTERTRQHFRYSSLMRASFSVVLPADFPSCDLFMTATQALDLHAVLADIRATISRMDDAMDSASENADIATIELARSMRRGVHGSIVQSINIVLLV